jgi:DNA helicase-2/ATP-dependent DNA helicase PcrA
LLEAEDAGDVLEALVQSITQDDVPQHPDFVRVMSLHKSKGLTSASVYIVGAVHGILPTVTSAQADEIEAAMLEGRRVFYVAVTRAAQELVISNSLSMDLADATARRIAFDRRTIRIVDGRHTIKTIASPYVAELDTAVPRPVRGSAWLAEM